MSLQKTIILSILPAKVALSIYIVFISSISQAQILYATEEQKTDAFFNETADNISAGILVNDPHYIYLQLLHDLKSPTDKEETIIKLKNLRTII